MWTQHQISGLNVDLFRPDAQPHSGAIIYLHGHAGESLSENPLFTSHFERHGLSVVAPHGGPCWWLDRQHPRFPSEQTPVQFVTQELIPWIEKSLNTQRPAIGLLGVSMGGQGVLNLAYRQALQFPVVVALSPAIDFDQIYGRGFGVEEIFPDAESARQETATLHIHPLNWPKYQFIASDPQDSFWHAGAERLASKLSSSGIPFTSDLMTSHGGHGWNYFNSMSARAIQFLADSLQQIRC